jgi:peptidase inhibitor family I36
MSRRSDLRRSNGFFRLALLLCAVLAFAVVGSGTAQAQDDVTPMATQFNGECELGEFCLYFNQNHGGPLIDYGAAGNRTCDSSYANNNFPGTNTPVANNTRSYKNLTTDVTVRLYDGLNYVHPVLEDVRPGSGNLAQVNWDRASSHRSIGSGC